MLSASELANAVKNLLQFNMSKEEVTTMHEYFRAKFRRSEVKRSEFQEMVSKKSNFKRVYDQGQAR